MNYLSFKGRSWVRLLWSAVRSRPGTCNVASRIRPTPAGPTTGSVVSLTCRYSRVTASGRGPVAHLHETPNLHCGPKGPPGAACSPAHLPGLRSGPAPSRGRCSVLGAPGLLSLTQPHLFVLHLPGPARPRFPSRGMHFAASPLSSQSRLVGRWVLPRSPCLSFRALGTRVPSVTYPQYSVRACRPQETGNATRAGAASVCSRRPPEPRPESGAGQPLRAVRVAGCGGWLQCNLGRTAMSIYLATRARD